MYLYSVVTFIPIHTPPSATSTCLAVVSAISHSFHLPCSCQRHQPLLHTPSFFLPLPPLIEILDGQKHINDIEDPFLKDGINEQTMYIQKTNCTQTSPKIPQGAK